MFQGLMNLGFTILAPIDFLVSIVGLLFYYLSKYKGYFKALRMPLLVILFFAASFFWFQLGGYFGPGTIGAVVVGICAIIIAPFKNRLTYFLLSIALILSLIYAQKSTDWVKSIVATKETIHINYFLFAFAALLIIYYVKREFDKERRQSEKQNVRLKSLNKLMKNTLKDKEKIIDKLKNTRDRLIDAEKMASIGRFTSGIAHELNNPLNFVGGSVWPIRQNLDEIFDSLSEDQKKIHSENLTEIDNLLQNIIDGTKQAQHVIGGLLEISPKSTPQKTEQINLSELLTNVARYFQNSFPKIHFKQDITENIQIPGYLEEINQVLVNLIKNSMDAVYGLNNPKIEISLKESKQFVDIKIEDNGVGIAKEDQPHIFEPFYTTKPPGVGTGVGLYISFTIANKHGGKLLYETKKQGSLFIFTLPAQNIK